MLIEFSGHSAPRVAVSRTCLFDLRPLQGLTDLVVNTDCAHDANHAGDVPSNILGINYRETAVDLACQIYDVTAGIDIDQIRRPQIRMLSNRILHVRCDPGVIG